MARDLVLVQWDDAEDPPDGPTWLSREEVEKFSGESCLVESVGFVESYTAEYLTLSGDFIGKLEHRSRVTKIPTTAILSVVRLERGEPYGK